MKLFQLTVVILCILCMFTGCNKENQNLLGEENVSQYESEVRTVMRKLNLTKFRTAYNIAPKQTFTKSYDIVLQRDPSGLKSSIKNKEDHYAIEINNQVRQIFDSEGLLPQYDKLGLRLEVSAVPDYGSYDKASHIEIQNQLMYEKNYPILYVPIYLLPAKSNSDLSSN